MKTKKLLLTIACTLYILLFCSQTVFAASNDFTATLSVSDTLVPAGSTVTSTISITNLDTTYGADITVSYDGQSIAGFYLGAGKSAVITHDVVINEQTDIYYTVYASHGPDISNTKDTNTVVVYIEQPATATPTPTATATPTATVTPKPTATATPTPYVTAEVTPTLTPEITPDVTGEEPEETAAAVSDGKWGGFVYSPEPQEEALQNLFKGSFKEWLGIGKNDELYQTRRIVVFTAGILVLSIVVFAVGIRVLSDRKSN